MDPGLLETVLDSAGDGVVAADDRGGVVFANSAARELLAFESAASVPVLPAELRAVRVPSDDALHLVGGRHLAITARPWRDPNTDRQGTVWILRNAKSHLFLDSIVENVPAMIFVKDAAELRFERFNRAGEVLLGIPRDSMIGKNDYDFFPPDQADFFQARDRETLREGKRVDIPEEPIDTQSGRRWLHTQKVPILDEAGQPKYLLGISVDITERKLATEALRAAHEDLEKRVLVRTAELNRANEQLRHAQKLEAVGRLAGGVAHDFNNILTAIIGYARLISDQLDRDAAVRKDLEQITVAAERAAALTRQLLAFSRRQVLQLELVDVKMVLDRMADLVRRLIGEDIRLEIRCPPDLSPVLADASQLEQLVLNLAVNARDAMPSGGRLEIEAIHVRLTEPTAGLDPGRYVRLSISDTGAGMSAETLARIFEPFFTTKPRGKGTGLGLATVFGIVKQLGGEISVQSEIGRGTRFSIHLPAVEGAASANDDGDRALTPKKTSRTILVVEDEDLVLASTVRILTANGFRVLPASSPREALALCEGRDGAIDLVLTDVVMPGMNGRELADRIKSLRPGVGILFMSGYPDDVLGGDSAVEFIAKPFTPQTLIGRIRRMLGDEAATD